MPSTIQAPDLTQRPPRSPRCRLGNLVILPRMLDKGRATAAGKQGEFHYNCPLDQHLLNFLGLDADALMTEIKAGKGDGELLEWIMANAKNKRTPWEIDQWSTFQDTHGVSREWARRLRRNFIVEFDEKLRFRSLHFSRLK